MACGADGSTAAFGLQGRAERLSGVATGRSHGLEHEMIAGKEEDSSLAFGGLPPPRVGFAGDGQPRGAALVAQGNRV